MAQQCPCVQDIDDYVHRIGRTGRAGKKGLATGFFCDADAPMARSLMEVLQVSAQPWCTCVAWPRVGRWMVDRLWS
jgi:superfamily II DNA/RNA helicase